MDGSTRFLVKQWLDGGAVFDKQFGDTHALDPAAFEVFLALDQGESKRSTLLEKFSPFYPDLTVEELADQFEEVLSRLQRLRLTKVDLN